MSKGFDVTDEDGNRIDSAGQIEGDPDTTPPIFTEIIAVTADLEIDLKQLMELLKEARESDDGETRSMSGRRCTLTVLDGTGSINPTAYWSKMPAASIILAVADIEATDRQPRQESATARADPSQQRRRQPHQQTGLQHRHDVCSSVKKS